MHHKNLSPYGTLHGNFEPRNRNKYKGKFPITYRSSWELKLMMWCDRNSNVIEWGSESNIVLWKDPTRNNTTHKYYVDFYLVALTNTGEKKKFLIEVKPKAQVDQPAKPKRGDPKKYEDRCKLWIRNMSKWKYATEYAKSRGYEFKIITENELGINT